jgi:hypothetical protein
MPGCAGTSFTIFIYTKSVTFPSRKISQSMDAFVTPGSQIFLTGNSTALNWFAAIGSRREHIFYSESTFPCHSPAIFKMSQFPAAVVCPEREFGTRLLGSLYKSHAGNTVSGVDFYSHIIFDSGPDNFIHSFRRPQHIILIRYIRRQKSRIDIDTALSKKNDI